jgi:hypothetical protein
MTRILLVRGMLVGLVAGLVATVIAKTLGERSVGAAILFEAHHEASALPAGATDEHGPEVFSRTIQSTAGLLTGTVFFAIAIGGIFGVAFALVQGRLGTLGARPTAALVSLGGFTAVYLIPILKYPANPPAASNPDTIGSRTGLFFLALALGVVVVIGTAIAGRQLSIRFGGWNGGILAGVGALVVLTVAFVSLPGVHETPEHFPADVLWSFRIASLAIQASVWLTIGLLFGALTERSVKSSASSAQRQFVSGQL